MLHLSKDAKRDYESRKSKDRLQRKKNGGVQLPSARGPRDLVPSDPNFVYMPLTDQGLTVRKNRKNRFCVIRWHYTADPEKRDPEYAEKGRAANPAWDQEMEIDFKSKRGIKVFSEFTWRRGECDFGLYWSTRSNVILPYDAPPHWWPLNLATDPGRNRCWATLFVLVDEFGIWHVWKSIVKAGMHYKEAKKMIAGLLGRRKVVDHVIDPASNQRRTDSIQTLTEKMGDRPFPMHVIPVAHLGNEYLEIEELRERMMKRPDGLYGVYFWDTADNQACIDQFRNAVYADDYGERLTKIDVDAVDAGKYLATHVTGRAVKARKPVDEMSPTEYRTHLTSVRRHGLEKEAARQQKIRDGLEPSEYA